MNLTLLKSKLHRLRVTGSYLNYEGSIFIDKRLLMAANILKYEKVDIYNVNNGQRFSTYAVPVEEEGFCGVNGAAARMVQTDDLLIVCAYASFTAEEAKVLEPKVIIINAENNSIKMLK